MLEPLLMNADEARALRGELGQTTLLGRTLLAEQTTLEAFMAKEIVIPGQGEAGGAEHECHKKNAYYLNLAARFWFITRQPAYLTVVRQLFAGYAERYPTISRHVSRDSNPPGKLFHQTLNENMWLLAASEAFSYVSGELTSTEQEAIRNQLLLPMARLFTEDEAHDFDIIHNHGTWSVAAVAFCGYALGEQRLTDQALYGLAGDGIQGGYLAQLKGLFSCDGYYLEGPYYHRFALRPLLLLAEVIARRQPELDIYQYHDQILRRTSYALLKTLFPDGTFAALNDASKSMGWKDEGVIIAASLCHQHYGSDPQLSALAAQQGRVWGYASGLTLSRAVGEKTWPKPEWGSCLLRDGPAGERGGLGVLRTHAQDGDPQMALIWFGQHGSDPMLHSALDHGHFDGLHLSWFSRGREVLRDYGFGRWLNIEPKFGGRYIPENKSYCKQSVAHNTVVVDGQSHYGGETASACQHWGELHFFSNSPKGQGMSALLRHAYPGVVMKRTVLLLPLPGFESPLLLDLFHLGSNAQHTYDYTLHYRGQWVDSDLPLSCEPHLIPLGTQAGYQHLWLQRRSEPLPQAGSVLFSWLDGDSYYSMVAALPAQAELLQALSGANDPKANLRQEPLLLLRTRARELCYATAFEAHGFFDEASECSRNARGYLRRVELLFDDEFFTLVRLHCANEHRFLVVACNTKEIEGEQSLVVENLLLNWSGPFSWWAEEELKPR